MGRKKTNPVTTPTLDDRDQLLDALGTASMCQEAEFHFAESLEALDAVQDDLCRYVAETQEGDLSKEVFEELGMRFIKALWLGRAADVVILLFQGKRELTGSDPFDRLSFMVNYYQEELQRANPAAEERLQRAMAEVDRLNKRLAAQRAS